MTAAQWALFAWYCTAWRNTAHAWERWLRTHYGVTRVSALSDAQAQAALARLQEGRISMDSFKEDRRKALLSLDLARVRAYMRKYGERPPDDDQVLLVSIHKARTGAKDLPQSERLHSKQWLAARGYSSMDDGDLTPEQEREAPMT